MTLINDMKTQCKQKRFHSPDDIDGIWQLLYPEHFINVLLIHHIKQRTEKDIENVASSMMDGLMLYDDDLSFQFFKQFFPSIVGQYYQKRFKTSKISDIFELVQNEDGTTKEPKLILIDGAPGMGKTTLCKEIAYQWAEGALLKDTKLVFLLFLPDPRVQRIHDLKDFIHYFYKFEPSYLYFSKQCAEMLIKRDNSDITILMDGYDEFGDKRNDLLIKYIINRDVLSQCKIVITSRPTASEKLQKRADVRVEVLGFNEEGKREYIEKEFKDHPEKTKSILTYLDNNSVINEVCYIPIMMTILVCTFKKCEELPTNQSELYERFITLAISRCLQKLEKTSFLSLNELPERYQTYLQQLSEFAFKTIENDKIIFSIMDIERLSPNLALSSRELQGLGLFKATEIFSFKMMDNCMWYNFLHLSIHEFLAAYYLKSLKPSEQFQILAKTFFVDHYINVWVMFVGLQQNVTYDIHQLLLYIHMHNASNAAKDQVIAILQTLYFSNTKIINVTNIKGSFQILCCRNSKDDLQIDLYGENYIESLESQCLLPSNWRKSFVSLCSVNNDNPLIEVYLLYKNKQDVLYHQVITKLEENQNLSLTIVNSNTLVGYRSKYHQLTDALNMNGSLEYILLRNCTISNNISSILSSYFITFQYVKRLSITDCEVMGTQSSLNNILQGLKDNHELEYLHLSNNNMTEDVAEGIASVIKNNPDLEKLYLSNNGFKSSASMILKALAENSKLKHLNLNNNDMTELVVKDIANVIRCNSNLEQLHLENNRLGPSTVVILQALAENSKLRILKLDNNNMTEQVTGDLGNVIKSNSNLEQLGLEGNEFGPSVVVILQALQHKSKLTSLTLCKNNMNGQVAEDLANVIKNNSNLEQLLLRDNKLGLSIVVILKALKGNCKLKSLFLKRNNITGQQVAECLANVIKNNSDFEALDLSGNDLRLSAMVILQALQENSKLKILDLSYNKITGQAAKHLANVIKVNSNLEQLGLECNELGPAAVIILRTLKHNSKLTFLNLGNNKMTEQVAEDLADVINNNPNLGELNLEDNKLGASAILILQALQGNCKLTRLSLDNNNITRQVGADLANVIKGNCNLKQLGLGGNELGPSAISILQALQHNSKLTILSLGNNKMTEQVAEDLESVIKNNPYLESLKLENNRLGPSAIVILQALQHNSKLTILDLGNNKMTEQVAEDLANVISNNSQLEQLGLQSNELGPSAAIILQALQHNSKLTLLDLGNNKMTEQVAVDLANVINNNPQLEQLDLQNNELGPSAAIILQALRYNSKLTYLNLGSNNMTGIVAADLAEVIKNNTDLECLILENNELGSSAVLIFRSIEGNSKLKNLNCNSNNMTGQVAEYLANVIKNNSGLEQLSLFGNNLKSCTGVILKALEETFKLKVLNLGSNNMTGEVIENLARVIKNNPNLEELFLSDNKLGASAVVILKALERSSKLTILNLNSNNMTGQVAKHLANVIKNNSSLEELCLLDNNLRFSTAVILQALEEHSTLKILNLSSNHITSQVAENIANVIHNNSNLEKLDLANNELGPSAVVILQALKHNSKLTVLNLNNNKITGQVAKDLASVIKSNSGLRHLYLFDNDLKSSAVVILKALEGNAQLETLELSNNNITREVAENLASMIENNSNLKMLGLGNNELGPSAVVILQSLKHISKLTHLNLDNNKMTEQVAEDLADVMRNNSGLEMLLLSKNNLNFSALVILQALKHHSKLKIISLSNNNITGQVAEHLAAIIKNNSQLEQLYLANNKLGSSTTLILKALEQNSSLKILNLANNNMSKEVAEDLANVIRSNIGLEQLYLYNNNLKLSSIVVLEALKENSELKVLDLVANNITGQAARTLSYVIKNNPNLITLGLGGNKFGSSAVMILQALKKKSNLNLLNLHITASEIIQDLVNVIKSNPGLDQLYLSDIDLKSSATLLFQALKDISVLNVLFLNNTYLESTELVFVIKNNPCITKLLLGNNILQRGLIDIATSCQDLPNLQVLGLSHNNVSPTEVVKSVSFIANINSLQVLILGGLVLSVKERFHFGVFQCYGTCKQKHVLHTKGSEILEAMYLEIWRSLFSDNIKLLYTINNNYYDFTDVINMRMILAYSKQNINIILLNATQSEQKLSQLNASKMIVSLTDIIKTLKVLDLGYSNISDKAAVELATVLNCNNALEQLWLRGNVLGADGAAVILTSLQNITTLRVLDLSYNNISSRSANGIAAVINSNHFLEQLWLDGNMLMTTGVVIIASALKKHSNLRLLSLSNNEITEDAAEEISAIVNSKNLLEGLLLSNNQLQSIGTCKITKSFKELNCLHILELANNCIEADRLIVILSNCTYLKQLYLGNNNLGTTGGVKVCQALKSNAILQTLSLNNNNITTEAASEICNVIITNTNLNILLLGGNDLQTSGVLQIADTVKNNNPTMQLLSLSDNNVDEQVKEDIKVMLCDQCDLELFI